jgi:uncharacterized membrane protein YhaH (DUF805 family)
MDFWRAIQSGFTNYVTFSGRTTRSEFWYWVLFTVLGAGTTYNLDAAMFPQLWPYTSPLYHIFSLLTFLPSLAISARRLHDHNRSGGWLLIALTIIGAFVLIYWFCKPGTPGDNRFGQDPLREISPR